MNQLSKWLQNNPIVVLLMFLISLGSGVIGLALGWKQFYKDYLSKTVELPVWLLLLIVLIILIASTVHRSGRKGDQPKELIKVEGKKFGIQQIHLDGMHFARCEFHGTEITFEGTSGFSLEACAFDTPRFVFQKHAELTLLILSGMYKDPVFRPLIDKTLETIRTGQFSISVPPTESVK